MSMEQSTLAGPDPGAFAGSGPWAVLKRSFLATRPGFLTASLLPVVAGTAVGASAIDRVDWLAAVLAALATVLVHAASNVLNDYGDDVRGTDRVNRGHIHPYTGGSRLIQSGILSREETLRLGTALLLLAMVPGIALLLLAGPMVIWLGLIGIALGAFYSLPTVYLSGRGLGELTVAVAFGPLSVMGAAWLQDGMLDANRLLVALPVGLWVACILLVNEIPDRAADEACRKRTLAVLLGTQGTRRLYLAAQCTAFALAGWAMAENLLAGGYLPLGLMVMALAIVASRGIIEDSADRLRRGVKLTLAIQVIGTVSLTIAAALSS